MYDETLYLIFSCSINVQFFKYLIFFNNYLFKMKV